MFSSIKMLPRNGGRRFRRRFFLIPTTLDGLVVSPDRSKWYLTYNSYKVWGRCEVFEHYDNVFGWIAWAVVVQEEDM